MITSKQRGVLRAQANGIETILQIGKGGISDETIIQVRNALIARELIKLRVLETSPMGPREAAEELALACRADVVQVIGTRFVLYKRNEKNPKIRLK